MCVPWQGLLLAGEGNDLGSEQEDGNRLGVLQPEVYPSGTAPGMN